MTTTTKNKEWTIIPHSKMDAVMLINRSTKPARDVNVRIGNKDTWSSGSVPAGGSMLFFQSEEDYVNGETVMVTWKESHDDTMKSWQSSIRPRPEHLDS